MNQEIENIIFWQNIVSPHQFPYIRRIPAVRPNWKVHLVVDALGSRHRTEMGWNNHDAVQDENLEILVSPHKKKVDELLNLPNAIHLLGGIKENSNCRRVIEARSLGQFKLGLISEHVDLRGSRAITRRLASWAIERPLKIASILWSVWEEHLSIGIVPVVFLSQVSSHSRM